MSRPRNMIFEPAPRSPQRQRIPQNLANMRQLTITAENLPWFSSGPDVLSTCTQLLGLTCEGLGLTRLPELPSTLNELFCTDNQIIALPRLPSSLEELYCGENALTSLPELPTSLTILKCNNNLLTTLPSLPEQLEDLNCSHNLIAVVPRLPTNLIIFNCSYNRIVTMPPLGENLQTFNCSNNLLSIIPPLPGIIDEFDCTNNPLTQEPRIYNTVVPRRFMSNPFDDENNENENNSNVAVRPMGADIERINFNGDDDISEYEYDDDYDNESNTTTDLYNNLMATPLAASTATIPANAEGMDTIMMSEENVRNYLQESEDNIVFKQGSYFFLHTKSAIINHIIPNTSAIKYGCLSVGQSIIPRPENVNMEVPYITGRALGLTVGVIPLSQIKTLLTMATMQAVEIVATNQQLPSTASFQMMQPTGNAVGASHCQEGQGETVYDLLEINLNISSGGGGKHRQTYRRRGGKRRQTYRRRGGKRRQTYRRRGGKRRQTYRRRGG